MDILHKSKNNYAITYVVIITLLLAHHVYSDGEDYQPENGFYLSAQGKPAPFLKSHGGHEIFLGEKRVFNVRESWLSSQNNENTKFYLSVTIPYEKNIGSSTYILLVAGKAYKQTGAGSSHKKSSSLNFNISGAENAKQVSNYIKTPIEYRKHPRHNLCVSFTPKKQAFSAGEEVSVTLRIANVGANVISFMKGGRNRAVRDNQYVFSARLGGKQAYDIGTSHHFGGIATRRVLKPNEIFIDKINLSKWFAFDKTGAYDINGSYFLNFIDPGSESYNTIWEDYASAYFTVRINGERDSSNK